MSAGLEEDRPATVATLAKQLLGAGPLTFSISSELLDWIQMLALRGSARATLACVHAFAETDFRRDLATFRVPTLIIHGDADATVPADKSARLAARLIAGSELKIYSGAPHGLFYTERNRLNQDLLAFIKA